MEIHCHGGNVMVRNILELIVGGSKGGRAGNLPKGLLNGRIDCPASTAVMDIIHSKSDMGLKTAVSQRRRLSQIWMR